MLLEFQVYLRAEEVDVCGEGDGLVEAVDAAAPLLVVEPHPLVTIVQPLNHQTRGAAAGVPAGWTAGPRCGASSACPRSGRTASSPVRTWPPPTHSDRRGSPSCT